MKTKYVLFVTLKTWVRVKLLRKHLIDPSKLVEYVIQAISEAKLAKYDGRWLELSDGWMRKDHEEPRLDKQLQVKLSPVSMKKIKEWRERGIPVPTLLRFELRPWLLTHPMTIAEKMPSLLRTGELNSRARKAKRANQVLVHGGTELRDESFATQARNMGMTVEEWVAARPPIPDKDLPRTGWRQQAP